MALLCHSVHIFYCISAADICAGLLLVSVYLPRGFIRCSLCSVDVPHSPSAEDFMADVYESQSVFLLWKTHFLPPAVCLLKYQ